MNHKTAAAMKAIFLAVLIFSVIFSFAAAESYDAGTMRLLRHEGSVEIFDPAGVSRFVLENVRFSSGEVMQTGEDGIASIGLDDTKIVTLGASSRVQFMQEDSHLKLSLSQGTLFLDVQDKLDENESLDIETSTMTVGIRGTIVFIQESPEEISGPGGAGRTQLGILEGTAQIDFTDSSGARRRMDVPAGRKVTIPVSSENREGVTPEVAPIRSADVEGFVAEQILSDPVLTNRVINGSPEGEAILDPDVSSEYGDIWIGFDFPAEGDWVWNETVTLVAQSASKLYDGATLRRTSDVLVYGLPQGLSIQVAAGGAQTDAGECENAVADYHIYNAAGEDVTGHFSSVEKVSGTLKVDPVPLTVWTGSAEKYYDGKPLTSDEVELRTIPGYEADEPVWRNTSIVTRSALGSESMISVSGATWVHGTNPITGETREILLYTGQKLSVFLHSEEGQDSIEFVVTTLPVAELPEEVLRLYADNPRLRAAACRDAGWDEKELKDRIAGLEKTETRTVTRKGLKVSETVGTDLMQDSSNVRITVDSDVTNYNSRPLNENEAHFVPIELDPTISVAATGSQTEPGESLNTYQIDWGTANPANYIVSEELGTLTVLPVYKNETTLTAASAEKVYDGKPLEKPEFEITDLPEGYTVEATVEGSRTDAGEGENTITEYTILDRKGKDATKAFPNLKVVSGTLKITPAPLTVTTGSAEKVYDGEPLTSPEVTLSGLVDGETAEAAATGTQTEVGSTDNTYAITWGTAKEKNYTVQETLGTLTVEALDIELSVGGTEAAYSGGAFVPVPALTYLNGSHAGETISGTRLRSMDVLYRFTLFTGETVSLTITGMGTVPGTYTLTAKAELSSGGSVNLDLSFTETELVITPAELTITTGSASRLMDGTPLTCSEVTVEGLQGEDTVTVTATGKLEEAGKVPNTYSIDWGETDENNYTVIENLGTLEMTVIDASVTLTAASATKAYDGTELIGGDVDVDGLPAGYTCNVAVTGRQLRVGSCKNEITSYQILSPEGNDVTAAFTDVTKVDGLLTVTTNDTPITIRANSDSMVYNGQSTGVFGGCTVVGLPLGVEIFAETQCTVLDAQTYTLTPSYYMWDDDGVFDHTEVFTNIKPVEGTLTVDPLKIRVDLGGTDRVFGKGASVQRPSLFYLNGDHTGEPVTSTDSSAVIGWTTEWYTLFTEDKFQLDMKGYAAEDVGDYTIGTEVAFSKGKPSNYEFVCENKEYHVTPATVTITTGSAEKFYDGTALTSAELEVKGLVGTPGVLYEEAQQAVVTVTGSQTEIGTSDNTYTIDWRSYKPANYTVTPVLGKLTVKGHEEKVTITAKSASRAFDGTPLTAGGADVSGLPEGYTCEAVVSGSQTDVGTAVSEVSSYRIYNSSHTDVTGSFSNVATENGTLTVTQLDVVVKLASYNAAYTGMPITPDGMSATAGGGAAECEDTYFTDTDVISIFLLPGGGKMKVVCSGFTDAGPHTFSPDISFTAGKAGNYNVSFTGKQMTIDKLEMTLDLGGGNYTYDGKLHGGNLSVSSLDDFYEVEKTDTSKWTITRKVWKGDEEIIVDQFIVTLNGPWKDVYSCTLDCGIDFVAGKADNFAFTKTNRAFSISPAKLKVTTHGESKTYDGSPLPETTDLPELDYAFLDDGVYAEYVREVITDVGDKPAAYQIHWGTANKDNYEISESLGTLTIKARDLTVSTPDDEKTYDGSELTRKESTIDGLAYGESITVNVTGSITDAGETKNSFTIDWDHAKSGNYNLTEKPGNLTVKRRPLTVTSGSAEKDWDGKPLTCEEFTADGLVSGESIDVDCTGSQTDIGKSDNTFTVKWTGAKEGNYILTPKYGELEVRNPLV